MSNSIIYKNRQKTWNKVISFISFISVFLDVLPRWYVNRKYEKSKYKVGKSQLFWRYLYLKRLGVKFTDNGYCLIQQNVCIYHPERLSIGGHTAINENSYIECEGGLFIGNDVMIGHGVSILTNTHNHSDISTPMNQQGLSKAPVNIGNNVWIGAKATITLGVSIGDNVIIGANAFVNKDIPDNVIVGGIPAKIIKKRQ